MLPLLLYQTWSKKDEDTSSTDSSSSSSKATDSSDKKSKDTKSSDSDKPVSVNDPLRDGPVKPITSTTDADV